MENYVNFLIFQLENSKLIEFTLKAEHRDRKQTENDLFETNARAKRQPIFTTNLDSGHFNVESSDLPDDSLVLVNV